MALWGDHFEGYPRHQRVVVWSWKAFLNPLNSGLLPPASGRTAPFVSDQSLVGRFTRKLAAEHDEKSREKEEAVTEAIAALQSLLLRPDFGELQRQWKQYERALKIKSDRESTGSTWTIAMLERYIQRQDIAFVPPEIRHDLTEETLDKIYERVDFAVKAVCGPDGSVRNLNELYIQPNSTESDTRMILDAILQPLCVFKGLTLRSEQTIKSDALPINRYDYIMYNNVNDPIGVVEAKRQACLKDQSVAQLLVQLLLLSSEKPDWFYFGILSDAHQFVFAGVSMQKILFFQTNENQLDITTAQSNDDLRFIVSKISWLTGLAIQSRSSSGSSEVIIKPLANFNI